MIAIRPPAALALDFPAMSEHSTRPPYAIDRAEYAPELAATIADRRAFNDRMVAKGSMSQTEADQDLAPLIDLALDVAAPVSWPRPDRACSWADKAAMLRTIIAGRRKKIAAATRARGAAVGLAVGDCPSLAPVGPGNLQRLEALEGLHWKLTIELGWCDAFDAIANHDQCVATIRAWAWAIALHERRAADAGESWARPDRSTAGRAAWHAANPGSADNAAILEQAEQAAALQLGIAVMDQAA